MRESLAYHDQDPWFDSRELRGGDPLWPEAQAASRARRRMRVVVSPASQQSAWATKELRHALHVQKQRGRDQYRVIPLLLDGTKLRVMEVIFGEEPK